MNLKLNIELIPFGTWHKNFRTMVNPITWDLIRKLSYKLAGYRCEICNDKGSKWPVECHEIWQYDLKQKTQKLVGFQALCPLCHLVKHMGFANTQGRAQEAIDHFIEINKVTRNYAEDYISSCFKEWRERSKYQWKIDIDYVGQYLNNERGYECK